jgi:16S rRNA (guanine527-N7)-methyltransferase
MRRTGSSWLQGVDGPVISELAARELDAWLDQLAAWNQKMDLTAARSADELVDLMVADAAFLRDRIPEHARVVDVGTGAGAPGLALAILRRDLTVTLAEPLVKRVSFLRTTIAALGLTHVKLEAVRGEALPKDAFDVAISRATLPPAEWLALGLTLAPACWVFLAKELPLPGAIEFDAEYTWPRTGVSRRAVLYRR